MFDIINVMRMEGFMEKNVLKTELNVINNKVRVMRINNTDYLCLTDLARYANPGEPKIPIQT